MTLNDLKIGTQLRLGMGVILLCVVALGALAWRQSDLLWLQTKTLYEHPYLVRLALDNLEAVCRTCNLDMGTCNMMEYKRLFNES